LKFCGHSQADLIEECCKYGKVLRLVVPEGALFDDLGCVAVTFEHAESAVACTTALEGRRFDGRVIETMVFYPPEQPPPALVRASAECKTDTICNTVTSGISTNDAVPGTDGADVDDFLNSLL
jgi:hypothetical protein